MAERITFYSDGIELVGYLYTPKAMQAGEKRSAIVLCPGFGAHQERFLPDMAGHLTDNGFVTLTFDYRGFGESDGHRWRMIPQEQVKDILECDHVPPTPRRGGSRSDWPSWHQLWRGERLLRGQRRSQSEVPGQYSWGRVRREMASRPAAHMGVEGVSEGAGGRPEA